VLLKPDAQGAAMSEFFKTSTTWVVDFRYDGHPRRWFKLLRPGLDAQALMAEELRTLYGARAQLVDVRTATPEEESRYLRGEAPTDTLCPTGRSARADPRP
jgi:hypothetical protein